MANYYEYHLFRLCGALKHRCGVALSEMGRGPHFGPTRHLSGGLVLNKHKEQMGSKGLAPWRGLGQSPRKVNEIVQVCVAVLDDAS